MTRSLAIGLLALALGGCSSAPARLEVLAASQKPKLSDDIACMVDCLEDGSETCESCADRCLERTDNADVVASLKL